MAILEVKKFEAKFIGMPLGREPSAGGKKGKLIYSPDNAVFMDIGELDADKNSVTFGKKVCKVGKTYILDQWQIQKYGAAFDLASKKEVKGYVLNDGETDDEAEAARQKARLEAAKMRQAEEAARQEELKKLERERIALEKKQLEEGIAAKKKASEEAAKRNAVEEKKGKTEKGKK